jgi:hypothetical protein
MDCRVKPGNDVIEIRSRDATGHPSYGKHGQMKRENGSARKSRWWRLPWFFAEARFANHYSRTSLPFIRATKERIRRRNADRRNGDYAVPFGHGRAPYEGRTTVGVPPRLSPKGLSSSSTQLQARLPGTWPPLLGGCYPAPADPSPAIAPRAPVIVPGG